MHILSVFLRIVFSVTINSLILPALVLYQGFLQYLISIVILKLVLQKNIEDEKRQKTQILVINLWCYLVIIFCY